MRFYEKEFADGTKKYYIGDKEVSEDTFNKLSEDDTLDVDSNFPEQTIIPMSPISQVSEEDQMVYDWLVNIIEEIRTLPVEDAIEFIHGEFEKKIAEAYLSAQKELYDVISNWAGKNALRIEIDLENMIDEEEF